MFKYKLLGFPSVVETYSMLHDKQKSVSPSLRELLSETTKTDAVVTEKHTA